MPLTSLRLTLRRLARSPLFTATAIATLALAIGANTAIWSIVRSVLLEPLPYVQPERLVGLWHRAPGITSGPVYQSPATYFTYRDDAGSVLENLAIYGNRQVSVTGLAEPEQVNALAVTQGFFDVLGVAPESGRTFTEEDDTAGSPPTVVVSHGYFARRLGGDPAKLNSTLVIDGVSREIVGVAPRGFQLLDFRADLYLPLQLDRASLALGNFSFLGIGRLRPGVTPEQATRELDRLLPVAAERFPGGFTPERLAEAGFAADVHPLAIDVVGDVGSVLWVLAGSVGLVLLIACANVANLFLVRAEGRGREVAVRAALGAGRLRIVRQLLGESVTLGLGAGALGMGLAGLALPVLLRAAPEGLPRLGEIGMDAPVLLLGLAASVLAGLLFGLAPATRVGRQLAPALRDGGRAASAGRRRQLVRGGLVVVQVALALVLLVGSGLLIQSFRSLRAVDPGFRSPEGLLTFRLTVPAAEVPDDAAAAGVIERVHRALEAMPGVASVAAISELPLESRPSADTVVLEDFPTEPGQVPRPRRYKWVAGDVLGTFGNRLVAGRAIDWDDVHRRAKVAMISEGFARDAYGDPSRAVGRRLRAGVSEGEEPVWREIVGVVGDVHDDGLGVEPPATVYWPLVVADFWGAPVLTRRSMAFAVRADGRSATGMVDEVEQAVWSVDPDLPLANVVTLAELVRGSLSRTAFTLLLLEIAAGFALLLGVLGLYGTISYLVSQRTREIGVRMALGARRADVTWLVVRYGAALAGFGVVLGLAASLGVTRWLEAMLFGVSSTDPATFVSVALLLCGVALAACVAAARGAAEVDPIDALRAD